MLPAGANLKYNKMKKLFIWIPRTGGTSIWAAIDSKETAKTRTSQRIVHTRQWYSNVDITTFEHQGFKSLPQAIREAYTPETTDVFTVVRNPWDRLVSIYERLRTGRIDEQRALKTMCIYDMTFEGYVREFVLLNLHSKVNSPYREGGWSFANPQVSWINSYLQPDAIRVFRFEKLQEVFDWLGLPICHHNAVSHKPYQEYYTPELRDAVGEFYKQDIETFSYSF